MPGCFEADSSPFSSQRQGLSAKMLNAASFKVTTGTQDSVQNKIWVVLSSLIAASRSDNIARMIRTSFQFGRCDTGNVLDLSHSDCIPSGFLAWMYSSADVFICCVTTVSFVSPSTLPFKPGFRRMSISPPVSFIHFFHNNSWGKSWTIVAHIAIWTESFVYCYWTARQKTWPKLSISE